MSSVFTDNVFRCVLNHLNVYRIINLVPKVSFEIFEEQPRLLSQEIQLILYWTLFTVDHRAISGHVQLVGINNSARIAYIY